MKAMELVMTYNHFIAALKREDLVSWMDHGEAEDHLALIRLPIGSKDILDAISDVCEKCPDESSCPKKGRMATEFLTDLLREGITRLAKAQAEAALSLRTKGENGD